MKSILFIAAGLFVVSNLPLIAEDLSDTQVPADSEVVTVDQQVPVEPEVTTVDQQDPADSEFATVKKKYPESKIKTRPYFPRK